MKVRTVLQGAGIAALVLFPVYGTVVDSATELRMHTPAPVTMFALSLVVNLLLVSLVSALLGNWIRNNWLKFLVPAIVLASLAEMVYINRKGVESVHLWLVVFAPILIFTLLLHWRWRRGDRFLLQLSGAILLGLGFFCIVVLFQLLHLATWRPSPHSTTEIPALARTSANGPRIVWILFDELSYEQAFEHRYPNLDLPNFDNFRKSSTLFTDTQTAVDYTEKAVPSILLGQAVEKVNYTFQNRLNVAYGKGPLHPFNPARTPFALARQLHLTTGVIGWYNPYCSILAPYVNECYWTYGTLTPSAFLVGDGFWRNLLDPWQRYVMVFHHFKQERAIAHRVRTYQDLMRRADMMLKPSGPDFVFVHLPAPHPPGFYNRRTQQFDISGDRSYIDNLALADRTLGRFLTILKQSPRWKDTSVVICGDHSWRTWMWDRSRYWTAEDEAASRGRVFDSRPLLMVHWAGQTTASVVNASFPLLRVHSILDDMIRGTKPAFLSTSQSSDFKDTLIEK